LKLKFFANDKHDSGESTRKPLLQISAVTYKNTSLDGNTETVKNACKKEPEVLEKKRNEQIKEESTIPTSCSENDCIALYLDLLAGYALAGFRTVCSGF
jgi:hypothetical protein